MVKDTDKESNGVKKKKYPSLASLLLEESQYGDLDLNAAAALETVSRFPIHTIKTMLKLPDNETVFLLIATAIAIAGHESGHGKSSTYKYGGSSGPWYSNIFQTLASELGAADPTVGPTQMAFSNVSSTSELADYAKAVGIINPRDLSDFSKAILATTGMLALMYEKAKRLEYDSNSPGVNKSYEWSSTGNAALDLAIVGYNSGPGKVDKYCGTEKKKTKQGDLKNNEKCIIAHNYIPRWKGDRGASTLYYVNSISKKLPPILKVVQSVMRKNMQDMGPKGPPENPGQRRGGVQAARHDKSKKGSAGPKAPNIPNKK